MDMQQFSMPSALQKLKSDIKPPLLIFIYTRILYYSSAFIIAKVLKIKFALQIFDHWDSSWYLSIVHFGYMHEVIAKGHNVKQANWAFFPVMPYLVKLLSTPSKEYVLGIAYLVSNLFLLIALLYLYKYLIPHYSPKVVKTTLIFIALSPVNVYFTAFYTESIFLALLVMTIYYIREHKWIVAGILGAFLSASRNTGIFMIAIYLLEFFRTPEIRTSISVRLKYLAGLAFFPTGILLFMFQLNRVMGDPLAFYHIQSAWGGPHGTYLTFIQRTLREHRALQIVDVLVLLAAILTCIYFLWKRKLIEFLVLAPVTLISVESSRIHYRFYFALYPIYLLVALATEKRNHLAVLVGVAEILLLFFSIKLWISGYGPT